MKKYVATLCLHSYYNVIGIKKDECKTFSMGGSSEDRLMYLVKLLQRTMTGTESELDRKIYLQLMVSCNKGKGQQFIRLGHQRTRDSAESV